MAGQMCAVNGEPSSSIPVALSTLRLRGTICIPLIPIKGMVWPKGQLHGQRARGMHVKSAPVSNTISKVILCGVHPSGAVNVIIHCGWSEQSKTMATLGILLVLPGADAPLSRPSMESLPESSQRGSWPVETRGPRVPCPPSRFPACCTV